MAQDWFLQAWEWLKTSGTLYSLGIMLAAIIAGTVVDTIFKRVLFKITQKTKTELDNKMATLFKGPIQLTIILMGFSLAIVPFEMEEHWQARVQAAVQSILLIVWAVALLRTIRVIMQTLGKKRRSDVVVTAALPMLQNLFTVLVVVGCGLWLLDLWKINITPLLASAGIATAAVALASKDTLANFFGGLSIILDAPYRLGDYVVLESGERGEVVHIGIRSTRVLTRDDVQITVPNAAMANAKIVNQTAPLPRFRVKCAVGVSYSSDPNQVEEVLLGAIKDISQILSNPEPRVRFRNYGDSSLNFELLAWVAAPADRGLVEHLMNKGVFYAFQAAGIEIPFPQRVLHFAQTEDKDRSLRRLEYMKEGREEMLLAKGDDSEASNGDGD